MSGWCIDRPVATTLIMLAVVLAGLAAWRALPVSALPHVEQPTITVTAMLPGASAEAMAAAVALPLERQFSTIAGLEVLTSVSGRGRTDIRLEFALDRTMDGAALDVQAALNAALDRLPREMTARPSLSKAAPTDPPILILALASETLPVATLTELAQIVIAPRIARLQGVAQAQVWGAQKRALRVEADPDALAAIGLSLDEVGRRIAAAAAATPLGSIEGPAQRATIAMPEPPGDAATLGRLIVASRAGPPVRLEDVATVVEDVESPWNRSWSNGRRGMLIAVTRQFDGDTLAIADAVKAMLPALEASLPPAASLVLMMDRSAGIRHAAADAAITFALAVAAVVLITRLFLGDWRATAIPALAIPVSILGSAAGMYLLGYSLNALSLLALTLAVGFVVDDAIVVLENIVRHRRLGMGAVAAARRGAAEVRFTIASMTLSLVAAFIPLLLAGGMLGRLFREFAVSLALAVLVSGIVSLTLTPMLSARLPTRPATLADHRGERLFAALRGAYERSLRLVLRHRAATLGVMLASLAASLYLVAMVPKGLLPEEDTGELWIDTEANPGIAFEAMAAAQQEVAAIVAADPTVRVVNSTVSADSFTHALNRGFLWVSLAPRGERRDGAAAVADRLRRALDALPQIRAYVTPIGSLNIGAGSGSRYPYVLRADNIATLRQVAPALAARLKEIPALRDVDLDLKTDDPLLAIGIDREGAARLGVSAEAVRNALYSAYGPRRVATIYRPSDDEAVLLEVDPAHRVDANSLAHVHVPGDGGRAVPLAALATVERQAGLATVRHRGQLPAATIWFGLAPGASLGEAMAAIEQAARAVDLPANVFPGWGDAAQLFRGALAQQALLVAAAVVAIYLVLGMLYESFLHPLTVLSGLPAAALGALATLALTGTPLTLVATLGMLLLMGIAKKNAIMMIDVAIAAERQGVAAEAAIREACLLRFRPIMMTTAAALAGALPLVLGGGAGSEWRRPLGLTILGGLVVSQLLTLYVSPAIYVSLENAKRRAAALLAARREGTVDALAEAPQPRE